jgi:nucleoside-diphosphate-sugar epimerase/2-polyprenyl-3-methyl-5-hydroxy-6-metoxy-1,4-benzoquinol methylase
MKILITGGTGFIGSRLAIRCKERNYEVKVMGLANTPAEAQNIIELKRRGIDVEPVSVLDRQELFEHLKDTNVVYHLAAAQHEMNVPDKHFWNVNVQGTQNVLDACAENGVNRYVHGSTIGVYGIVDGLIDENTHCNPENIYGKTKLEGEKLALSFNEKIPVVVIRIPEVYGPGDRRLLKLFKAIQKNSFFMIGNGKNLHHLIYIDDLIQAFFLAAEKDVAVGQVFLLAGEKPVSTDEMVETIAQHLGAKGSLFRVPFGPLYLTAATMETVLRPMGIQPPLHRRRMDFFKKSFTLSWQKAADVLNYNPNVTFSAGVFETARWYASMGFIQNSNLPSKEYAPDAEPPESGTDQKNVILESKHELTAKIEPFDSFWEAPDDIQKGYGKFATFYKHNYLEHFPSEKKVKILVISCGPGYMVDLLNQNGYTNVIGIDAMPHKIFWAKMRQLNCAAARAFDYLDENTELFDVIFCEQEINHLTKEEIISFLNKCRDNLNVNGTLILHSLNGANPLVGSENLALNFDHFNIFTEKSLEQILEFCSYKNIEVLPLNLYVFYKNPLNYVGIFFNAVVNQFLKISFKFYGKSNNIFTKKIAVICRK